MTTSYKFTPADIPPPRRGSSVYTNIIDDFIAQNAETMQVTVEGVKPATLRSGLRRALKGRADVKLAQRGDKSYLLVA